MDPVPVPRTAVEWNRVRDAKDEVLTRDPLTVVPADYPHVRPQVLASWRRSMLAGVDPDEIGFPVDGQFQPGTRLAAVAQPIMNRLKDQIADLNSIGFLADRACRLLTAVVGDFPGAARIQPMVPRPAACVGEDVVGTHGLGCAHELQQPFLVSGTEHFRANAEVLTSAGVIIRDPFTRRFAGTLGVHCRREYGSAAMLPLVVEIGRSIEAQLLASRTDGEREFFDAFSSAQRRFRGAVVGVSTRLMVLNNPARELLGDTDEELLRRIAEETRAREGRTLRQQLSSGASVRIEVVPIVQPRAEFAAILVLQPLEPPDEAGTPARFGRWAGARSASMANVREQVSRAMAASHPVLLTGERGCGKRHEARAALRAVAGADPAADGVAELDGAMARADPDQWLGHLLDGVQGRHGAVLIGHVTDVPAEIAGTVAELLGRAEKPVVGTAREHGADAATALLEESFPVVLTIPPLRERRDEFAQLCDDLLAGLGRPGDEPVTLAPRALAALVAGDWPGNVRQLFQVLASARIHATGPSIDLPDLPSRYGRSSGNGPMDEVYRAERHVLMAALREAGGNRDTVAERLGISRATVYRKLKRYELH